MSIINALKHRSVLVLRGSDSLKLLQSLVTNDVRTVSPLSGIAAFFLNTKGRIIDDVMISRDNGDILVECSASNRKNLKNILEKYRLRKNVDIIESHYHVLYCTEEAQSSFSDPRFPLLGGRRYSATACDVEAHDYNEKRIKYGIAEGCVIRRRVLPFKCEICLEKNSSVMQDGKEVGKVISCVSGYGLVLLSLIAFGKPLSAAGFPITPYKPTWMPDSALTPK